MPPRGAATSNRRTRYKHPRSSFAVQQLSSHDPQKTALADAGPATRHHSRAAFSPFRMTDSEVDDGAVTCRSKVDHLADRRDVLISGDDDGARFDLSGVTGLIEEGPDVAGFV